MAKSKRRPKPPPSKRKPRGERSPTGPAMPAAPSTRRRSSVSYLLAAAVALLLLALAGALRLPRNEGSREEKVETDSGWVPQVAELADLAPLDPPVAEALRRAVARAKQNPRDAEAQGDLGRLYHAHRYVELARQSYETARRLAPETPDWPYYLGLFAAERGQNEQARAYFESVLRLQPLYLPASYHLGGVLLSLGELSAAERTFSLLASQRPEEPWGHVGLARVERRRQRWADAVAHLEQAREIEGQSREIDYLLAMTLRELGREEEAEALLRGLPRADAHPMQDPILAQALNHRTDLQQFIQAANRLVAEGNPKGAEALYLSVLAADENHYEALYNLGLLYTRAGRSSEAQGLLERAVRSRPDSADGYFLLAMTLVTQGKLEEAMPVVEKVLALDPAHVEGRSLRDRLESFR